MALQQLQLPIMTAADPASYVEHAALLAEEVSLCRLQLSQVRGGVHSYNTCTPLHEPHVLSTCATRTALCDRKQLLYATGDLDFGGDSAQRNAVTEEWELFLKRIVRSSSPPSHY
jgi:hypothetical protein